MATPNASSGSFFEGLPRGAHDEVFQELVKHENVLIERIVSEGHTSSEWYDQEEQEFCCVLRGAADLMFEGSSDPIRMNPGSWQFIPAHAKHKVTWTAPAEPTVWIAIKWSTHSTSKTA